MKAFHKILFIILCCCTMQVSKAQGDSLFAFIKTIPGSFTDFTVDNLENIYALTPGNQLKKMNSRGDSLAAFNDVKRFGTVTQVDVTNPLKILLYYKSFSSIVVLDRFLNIRNTINLRKKNLFAVNAISTSYDNNIWLYDEQEYKLKKIDDDGSILLESNDMRMQLDSVPSAMQITDRNNFVYLYDSAKGFYIFDYYGTYKNRLPFLSWNNTAVSEKSIYGFSNGKLLSYQPLSFNLREYALPAFISNYTAIRAMNNKLYLLNAAGISIWQLK